MITAHSYYRLNERSGGALITLGAPSKPYEASSTDIVHRTRS